MKIIVIHKCKNSLFEKSGFLNEVDKDNQLIHYHCETGDIGKLNRELTELFIERTSVRKKACSKLGIGDEVKDWTEPDAIKQWRKLVRSETQPVLVIFESMLDFELAMTPELAGGFMTNFRLSRGYNVYFAGCHYPEDQNILKEAQKVKKEEGNQEMRERVVDEMVSEESPEEIRVREIRRAVAVIKENFNEDKFTLLFGGQFDRQELVNLPYEYKTVTSPCSPKDYNRFLLFYQERVARMKMPVGGTEPTVEDEDELSII